MISMTVIIVCTQIARKFPSLAGLIAVMPLTGVIVLLWIYADNPDNYQLLTDFTKSAVWGIIPSIMFFAAAAFCFNRQLPLWAVLGLSFGIWLIAAVVHQLLLAR
jgi:uncharacterized membrane protein (GlpM family)